MNEPERRRWKRTVLEDFTYISVAAENGGSVLNLSEGGLCFTSIAPIVKNGPVPVRFYDLKQRVEVEGEVVWTDATRKTGGLRFTVLSAEARDRLQHWKEGAGHSFGPQKERAAPVATAKASSPDAASLNIGAGSVEPNLMLQASGRAAVSRLTQGAANEPRAGAGSWALSGFARGLLTGLLVSLLFGTVLLFHAYREDFGEWLIHLGQKFATKPEAETRTEPAAGPAIPAAQASKPAARHAPLPAEKTAVAAAPATVSQPPKAQPQIVDVAEQPQPAAPAPIVVKKGPAKAHVAVPQDTLHPPSVLAAYGAATPIDSLTADKATLPGLQPAPPLKVAPAVASEESAGASSGPPPQMYFEVGKFKNPFGARETSNQIALLGLPASIQHKGHLLGSSYVVLVGPYNNEPAAEVAQRTLVESDFNPQPFERGSRTIELRAGVKVNGSNTSGGDCEIRWESYVTEATVRFLQGGSVVAVATGKWVPSETKYPRDAIVIQKRADGSRTLLEVRFSGMKRSLVVAKPL